MMLFALLAYVLAMPALAQDDDEKEGYQFTVVKENPSTTPKTKEYYEQIAQKLGRGIEPKKIREEFPREVA